VRIDWSIDGALEVHQYTSTVRIKDATRTSFERGATHESAGAEAAGVEEIRSREVLQRAGSLVTLLSEHIGLMSDQGQELETLTLIAKLDSKYTLQLLYCLGMEFRKTMATNAEPTEEEQRNAAQLATLAKFAPKGPKGSAGEILARREKKSLDDLERTGGKEGPVVESYSCACCERPLDSVKNKPRKMPLHVVVDAFGALSPPLSCSLTASPTHPAAAGP